MRRFQQIAALTGAAIATTAGCSRAVPLSPPSPAPAPTASANVAVVSCRSTDLRFTFANVGGASGRDVAVFQFTNLSQASSCSLAGYPGFQLLDSSGRPMPTQTTSSQDSSFGPEYSVPVVRPVVLAPGGAAKFTAEWVTQVGSCVQPAEFAAIPPNDTTQLTTPARAQSNPGFIVIVCNGAVTVHPVIPAQ